MPGAVTSMFPKDLKDDLAVGAASIGQERDLATPLQMAAVGATIANRGVHPTPRIVRNDKIIRRRAVSRRTAGEVRDMMLSVVRSGTGTAAALPGVEVAGKTGTAELRPTARSSLRSFGNMLVTAPGTRGGALKPKRSAAASIFLRPSLAPSGANTELQECANASTSVPPHDSPLAFWSSTPSSVAAV